MATRVFTDSFGEKSDWVSIPPPKTVQQEARLLALPQDEALYRVIRGVTFERVVTTPYYLGRWWEMKAGDDIYAKATQAANSMPEGKGLFLPDPNYHMSDTFKLNKRISIFSGINTKIYGPIGKPAIHVLPGARGATLEKFIIWGQGTEGGAHGIVSEAVIKINEVTCRNLTGHGFAFFGSVGQGTDSSHAKIRDCFAIENGGDGYHIQGADSNCIMFDSCSASDNKGAGFGNHSFLGVCLINPMCHYNAGGDYIHSGESGHTTMINPYAEGGGKISGQARNCIAIGGNLASGIHGGLYFEGEHLHGNIRAGDMIIRRNGINYDDFYMTRRFGGGWGYGLGEAPQGMLTLVPQGGAIITGSEDHINPSVNGHSRQRVVGRDHIDIPWLTIGGRLFGGYSGDLDGCLAQHPWAGIAYNNGDVLNNMNYNGTNEIEARCIAKGVGNKAKFKKIF